MLITCPSCSTSYNVDGSTFDAQGRLVRCTKCGNQWHQIRVAEQPLGPPPAPMPAYPAAPVPYPYPPAPGYGPPPPGYPPPYPGAPPQGTPYGYPQAPMQGAEMNTPPASADAPAPQPPPPPPASEPEPEPEPIPAEDLPSDEELDAMLGPEEEFVGSGSLAPASKEELTELDEEEIENFPDPEPLEALIEEDGDVDDDIEPDDITDPDPIPEVFSEPVVIVGAEEKSKKGLWISLSAVGVIVIIALGLIFARGPILSTVPGLAGVYALVGLSDSLGAGLRIEMSQPSRETEGENEYIVVKGSVTNTTDELKIVPVIRVSLVDAADKRVQYVNILPSKEDLEPGASFEFSGRIKNPIPTARRADVAFTEEEPTPEEAPKSN